MFKWFRNVIKNLREALTTHEKVGHKYVGEPVDSSLRLALNDLEMIFDQMFYDSRNFSAASTIYEICSRNDHYFGQFNELLDKYTHTAVTSQQFRQMTIGQLIEKIRPKVIVDPDIQTTRPEWVARVLGDQDRLRFVTNLIIEEVAAVTNIKLDTINGEMILGSLGIDSEHQRQLACDIAEKLARPPSMLDRVPISRYSPERTINEVAILFCELLQIETDKKQREGTSDRGARPPRS